LHLRDPLQENSFAYGKCASERSRWDPDTFGSTAQNWNPAGLGVFAYNLRFPGQYYLAESGLHYNYFRDYDPQTGRYVESDPIGLEGGVGTYTYVKNDPLRNADPYGLIKWKGEMYSALAAWIGGASAFHFDLKSDCINGKYAYVYVNAKAVIAGIGANVTGGAGPIEFDDGNSNIEPQGLQGTFRIFSAGAGIGLTYGWAYVQLGGAFSTPDIKPAPSIGFDASVVGGIGKSKLTHVEIKDCSCALN
jgi:RHS repeat-associated protein